MPFDANDIAIACLVSLGQHPISGRTRRADQDARAVELGLKLCGQRLRLLHAGNTADARLRDYLGMGLPSMTVLGLPESADMIAPLVAHLRAEPVDIVLTGMRAETGEASGMTPYLLAEKLDWPIVRGIVDIVSIEGRHAEVLQALPRGQRRLLKVSLPFIASVDSAAKAARQSAYGPALRGDILVEKSSLIADDQERQRWSVSEARRRAKRLKIIKAKTAADRFRAATAKTQVDSGIVMTETSPTEQAEAILKLLIDEGLFR